MKAGKKALVLMCFMLMSFGAGCEEVDVNYQELAEQTEQIIAQVNSLQAVTNEITETLETHQIVSPEITDEVDKINEEIDRIQSQAAEIAAAIGSVEYTGDDWQDLIAALQAANTASASFNPYAAPVAAGLTLASIVIGLFAKKKSDDAKKSAAQYQAHKAGVEKTMKEVSVNKNEDVQAVEKQLYDNIGEARKALGVT